MQAWTSTEALRTDPAFKAHLDRVEKAATNLPALKEKYEKEILPAFLSDNVKARELQPDGTYRRRHPADGQETKQAQLTFRRLARKAQGVSPS